MFIFSLFGVFMFLLFVDEALLELMMLLLLLRSTSLWSWWTSLTLCCRSRSTGVPSRDRLFGGSTTDGVPSRDMLGVAAFVLWGDAWGVWLWGDVCGVWLWDAVGWGEALGPLDTVVSVPRMMFSSRLLNAVPKTFDTLCCSTKPWISTTTVSGRISSTFSTLTGTFSFPDSSFASWACTCLAKKLSMAFICPVLVTGLSPYWICRSSYMRSLQSQMGIV